MRGVGQHTPFGPGGRAAARKCSGGVGGARELSKYLYLLKIKYRTKNHAAALTSRLIYQVSGPATTPTRKRCDSKKKRESTNVFALS